MGRFITVEFRIEVSRLPETLYPSPARGDNAYSNTARVRRWLVPRGMLPDPAGCPSPAFFVAERGNGRLTGAGHFSDHLVARHRPPRDRHGSSQKYRTLWRAGRKAQNSSVPRGCLMEALSGRKGLPEGQKR